MNPNFLRIGLIISLIISMFIIGGLIFFNEIFIYHITIGQLFPTAMLFLTQIVLLITLCVTKKSKSLLIVLIVNAVLIINLFAAKFYALEDFVKDYENRFNELIDKYPGGEKPDFSDWRLMTPYILIKKQLCCGDGLVFTQNGHYAKIFLVNCLTSKFQFFAPDIYSPGAPCMNFARMGQGVLKGMLILSLIVIIIILILYGIYIYLCRRDEQGKFRTGMAGTTYPTVIDPSDQWAHQPPIPSTDEKQ